MAPDPDDPRNKIQRGAFEREEVEELEEEEPELLHEVGGIANSEMERTAEAARLTGGGRKLSAEALAEMTQPWGISRYAPGGDEDEEAPKRGPAQPAQGDEEDGILGTLDSPLWHGIAAAPAPPPRPAGFPSGSKWVTSA